MVLEKLSQRIETARAHATALQRQAGALEPAATAALDQAVEELRAALDELQVAEEQARDQQDALLEARATIEAERERYRQLFRSASNAHLVTDPAGIVREANDAAGDLLGVPVRFLIDKPLAAFVDRTALATFFGAVKVLRETDKSVRELQVTLRLRNEPIGPVTLTVAAVRSPSGDLEGLRWLVHEPGTGRQLALLAAAETAKLRRLLEALPDGVLVHELDGRIVLANARVSELFGYSQEELIGQPAEALLPERFRARHEEHRAAYAEPPRTRPMGLGLPPVGRRKDGSEFPVDVSLGVVQVDGRVQLVSTIRDVTDQRSPEETRARLAAIVETATDAVIGKTVDGIVTSWNPAAERLFGYAAAEMIGRPFARLAPPEVHGEYQQAQMLVRRGIRVPPFDTVRFHKDGRRLDVNVCLSPILDRAGAVIGVSVVARDIAERRALEHLRDELLALTSRELRSPLGAIRGYAELLERQGRLDLAAVRGILARTEQLDGLVGDLTDDALIEAGHVELRPRSVDLVALVRSCADRSTARGGRRSVQVDAPAGRVIGRWDRDRLVQILDALCEVATRPVPADVQVRVQIVARNDAAQVTVTAPMAWSPLEHLQTLFHRSPRRSGMRRASYGPPSLWIATKLAEAHGGRLWAEVEDGQSAVLRLLLPYAPSAGGDEPLTRLTPRQLEIVALVAQGKTNREIAAALVLSQATVENHVDRILRRLGVRNRAAAASWAAEHGLARTSGG